MSGDVNFSPPIILFVVFVFVVFMHVSIGCLCSSQLSPLLFDKCYRAFKHISLRVRTSVILNHDINSLIKSFPVY